MSERAGVEASVTSVNTVRVESWHEVILELWVCDRALQIVVVGDSNLLAKGYD